MACCACMTFSRPSRLPSLFPPPPAPSAASLPSLHSISPATINRCRLHFALASKTISFLPHQGCGGYNNSKSNNNGGGGGGGGGGGWSDSPGGDAPGLILFLCSRDFSIENRRIISLHKNLLLFIISSFSSFGYFHLSSALAETNSVNDKKTMENELDVVWEVSRGRWVKLIADHLNDTFVVSDGNGGSVSSLASETNVSLRLVSNLWAKCRDLVMHLMLPEGFPESVTGDYIEYSLWRGVQGIAAQISGVLATQSLLFAVGLGKGAIPTAAAVNWVLKDGIGYVSKIFLSKFGRHFDVNPKGWRLFADFFENAAFGLEILTPAFPHLFVPIGAIAGAGRSAAALIQAATRSCFFAGFAAQRNFAEVIAKGEAQGMVSKFIGIMLGIALANYTHTSTPLALATFGVVTWIHMFCNLKSYQAIQLRTLNPYRASLVFSEYLLSGLVPSVKEVNDEEPFFPALPLPILKSAGKGHSEILSSEAKDAAANIEGRIQLGSKLSDVVESEDDAVALFDLYKDEGYMLTEHKGRYCVILKESSLPKDMLKSLFHVNYLYWLEKNAGIKTWGPLHDCSPGGKLRISLEYVEREFNHVKSDGEMTGWMTDSLIARPLPNRVRPGGDFALKV